MSTERDDVDLQDELFDTFTHAVADGHSADDIEAAVEAALQDAPTQAMATADELVDHLTDHPLTDVTDTSRTVSAEGVTLSLDIDVPEARQSTSENDTSPTDDTETTDDAETTPDEQSDDEEAVDETPTEPEPVDTTELEPLLELHNVGEATLERLYEAGYQSLAQIDAATEEDLRATEGIASVATRIRREVDGMDLGDSDDDDAEPDSLEDIADHLDAPAVVRKLTGQQTLHQVSRELKIDRGQARDLIRFLGLQDVLSGSSRLERTEVATAVEQATGKTVNGVDR